MAALERDVQQRNPTRSTYTTQVLKPVGIQRSGCDFQTIFKPFKVALGNFNQLGVGIADCADTQFARKHGREE